MREKLAETKYFLGQMREHQADRDAFKYNLSAFVAAARSVSFFMQKQLDKLPGFKTWYESKQDQMKNDTAMRFFLEARNITLKQEHVPTHAQVNVGINIATGSSVGFGATLVRADGTTEEVVPFSMSAAPDKPEVDATEATIEWRWYFRDLPSGVAEGDVVTLSEDHVRKLENLVKECESRFAGQV